MDSAGRPCAERLRSGSRPTQKARTYGCPGARVGPARTGHLIPWERTGGGGSAPVPSVARLPHGLDAPVGRERQRIPLKDRLDAETARLLQPKDPRFPRRLPAAPGAVQGGVRPVRGRRSPAVSGPTPSPYDVGGARACGPTWLIRRRCLIWPTTWVWVISSPTEATCRGSAPRRQGAEMQEKPHKGTCGRPETQKGPHIWMCGGRIPFIQYPPPVFCGLPSHAAPGHGL